MARGGQNRKMLGKLAVVVAGMFAFGYGMIPLYRHICEVTGINILALGEKAPQKPWEAAEGLEWEVPSPAPFHTFETPPRLDPTATKVIG